MPQSPPLVLLEPPALRMDLALSTKMFLKISNISDSNIVFKVKTTQPTWYQVRPWQQVLERSSSLTVEILLVESERRYLVQNKHIIQHSKNRFMVEHQVISDQTAMHIKYCRPIDKVTAFTKIWEENFGTEKLQSKVSVVLNTNDEDEVNFKDHYTHEGAAHYTHEGAAQMSAYERLREENIEKNAQFLEKLGISNTISTASIKKEKVAPKKLEVVKASRKLPNRATPGLYDCVNYQFGDILKGEAVQLKAPNRFGKVVRIVKGRRNDNLYTVKLDDDGPTIENLARTALWKVLKPIK